MISSYFIFPLIYGVYSHFPFNSGPTGATGPAAGGIFASFINFAARFTDGMQIPVGIGIADTTGSIVLTEPGRITLQPGYYSISYQVSALLTNAGYMQITPAYGGSSHIEYGIYYMTGTARTSAAGACSFIITVPETTNFTLYFNSSTEGLDGAVTLVICKLDREI